MPHKAGFVNIIGLPNVGKSTLLNALLGEKLSIATSKAQTTRQRIFGIYNDEEHQLIFSDSPGFIGQPAYRLHQHMNRYVQASFEDADCLLFMTDIYEKTTDQTELIEKVRRLKDIPKALLINKMDQAREEKYPALRAEWDQLLPGIPVFEISALEKIGTQALFDFVLKQIPEHPPYFPKDELSDRPERFFVSEIIREQIFLNYRKEIPYHVEVGIEVFSEDEDMDRIRAIIYTSKKSHKPILIGNKGEALKKVGIGARKEIEAFRDRKCFLELHVKIRENWRDSESGLNQFGYY